MAIDPCPTPTAPVKGVVRFVPADFKAAFPMFATVADAALSMNFAWATLLLNNSCKSIVCDATLREQLLNFLTAHITALFNGVNGQPPSGAVGRVADATEGSVSASLDYGQITNDEAFFVQTQWGAFFWTATARWRTFRYVPAPATCADGGVNGYPLFDQNDACGC